MQQGYADFVARTDPTDQNPVSTGCGMVFLPWLQSQGYALSRIAPVMVTLGGAATFAQLYGSPTGGAATDTRASPGRR